MYLDGAQLIQLAGALLAGLIIFVAAYAAPLRVSVAILLVMIPFQPVATSYGSANVIMTYVLAGALLLNGRLKYAPMLGSILPVLFAFMITISQLPRSIYVLHGIEMVSLVAGFLVFIAAYNLARDVEDKRFIINILLVSNVLAILYCLVQFTVAPGESLQLFGIKELSMNENRGGGDSRLVGPFGTPGITAAYFMSMTLLLTYEAMFSIGKRRIIVAAVAAFNVAAILATASRGSFLVLVAGLLLFIYIFRSRLGFARIAQVVIASTVVLAGTATVVSQHTEFGKMFDRLTRTTEMEDGVPKTRSVVWPRAWENIQERPILGHGPRLLQQHELRFRRVPDEQLVAPYPHNLYLHLMVSVGVVGTAAMLFFFFSVMRRIYLGVRRGSFSDEYDRGLVLMGMLFVITFLVDELKIEFNRATTSDYAQFVFAMFGIFVAWADKARAEAREAVSSKAKQETNMKAVRDTGRLPAPGPTAIQPRLKS